jgi:hypothetical protein
MPSRIWVTMQVVGFLSVLLRIHGCLNLVPTSYFIMVGIFSLAVTQLQRSHLTHLTHYGMKPRRVVCFFDPDQRILPGSLPRYIRSAVSLGRHITSTHLATTGANMSDTLRCLERPLNKGKHHRRYEAMPSETTGCLTTKLGIRSSNSSGAPFRNATADVERRPVPLTSLVWGNR